MAKKPKCPEFENHERWLVAYADMMTLLFALFVVLYSITNVEVEKLRAAAQSIQRAFGMSNKEDPDATGYPSGNSRTKDEIFNKIKGNTNHESITTRNRRERAAIISAEQNLIEQVLKDTFQGTKEYPNVSGESNDRIVYFNKDADGIRISLLSRGFFKPGQMEVDPSTCKVLDAVAAAVKGIGRVVRVEGHTDNRPPSIQSDMIKGTFSNWELSSMRAASVAKYFVERVAFPKENIYAAGFADTKPIAPNDSKHYYLNRRVDIKVLYESPSEYIDQSDKLPEKDQDEQPSDESTPSDSKETKEPHGKGASESEKQH